MTRRALLVVLLGLYACSPSANAPTTPSACRAARNIDPGPFTIRPAGQVVVYDVRCADGVYRREPSHCTDDSPAPQPPSFPFTVVGSDGKNLASLDPWWHIDSLAFVGSMRTDGLFEATGHAGGTFRISSTIGVREAVETFMARLVIVENPGHAPPDIIAKLDAEQGDGSNTDTAFRWVAPADKSVWPRLWPTQEASQQARTGQQNDQQNETTTSIPQPQFGGNTPDWMRLHAETASKSVIYDGYFDGAAKISPAVWEVLSESADTNEAIEVRATKLSRGIVSGPIRQAWFIDHGAYIRSPEEYARARKDEERKDEERKQRDARVMRTRTYISRSAAIARAEEWIREQGYTAAPHSPYRSSSSSTPSGTSRPSGSSLNRELWDSPSADEVFAARRDTLQPEAVGAVKKASGWWVAFRTRTNTKPCQVRAVALAPDGSRVTMIHHELGLEQFE